MDISTLNFLAVGVSAISSFILGGLWYSPLLFGKVWMRETGITEETSKNRNMAKIFGLAFIASLIIAFNLAMFLGGNSTLGTGVLYGFLAGFGWVAMSFAINAGYHTVGFTIMGAILGAWH